MQPVQDLTVEDRVSRTQFQYSLEDPNIAELNTWTPKFVEALQESPELRDVSSDQQDQGLEARLEIDRSTASRFGISTQLIDDTLYDAFGQRQISTIFTQLNQYRVVLEVKPEFRQSPDKLKDIYIPTTAGTTTVTVTAPGPPRKPLPRSRLPPLPRPRMGADRRPRAELRPRLRLRPPPPRRGRSP